MTSGQNVDYGFMDPGQLQTSDKEGIPKIYGEQSLQFTCILFKSKDDQEKYMAPPQPLGHLKYPDISKSNTFDNSFYGTSGHSLVKSVVITATHQETGWYGKSTRWYDIEMLDYRNSLKKVQRRHVDFYHLLHVLIKKYSNRFILCPFPAQTTSTLLGGEDNNSVALQKWLQFVCAHFHCELVNQWLIQQSLNLEGPQDEGLLKRAGSLVSWMFSGVLP